MEVIISKSYEEMCKEAAKVVAAIVNNKPNAVLGLATGSTPVGLYKELARMHKSEGLDFSHCTSFNLDEYVGLTPDHDQSYHYFMYENFFKNINIPMSRTHVPSGTTSNYEAFCAWYEEQIVKAGGVDIQILGIGSDGHIAFNEPGSSLGSRTRIKTLAKVTIDDNARFFAKASDVPIYAITMGVGTILESRRLLLMANGAKKAQAVADAVEGPVSCMCTASALQLHRDAVVFVDEPASGKLKMAEYYKWIQDNKPSARKR